MSRPLWHVIEDPAFVVNVFAGTIIVLMLIGAIIIYFITQSLVDSILVSLPPIFIALIMIAVKMTIKRNEVMIYPDRIVIIRGSEHKELPLYKLTKIRSRPVISAVRISNTRLIPVFGIPRLNTWSATFLSGNEEIVKVWINENELDKLRIVIRKLCLERSLCINIENALLSR